MSILKLENISKRFNKDWIFKNINLETYENEFVVFLGPSGSGKTTLLRIIAGLEDPTEGKIILDGKDITYFSPEERNIAMIFQNYPVYPHLNVYQNLSVTLKLKKVPNIEIKKRVRKIAGELNIIPLLHRGTFNLSGGELQRVAIGKALIKNPNIFLMDEPLQDLDAQIKISVKKMIKQVYENQKKLFLYVTHDHTEAISLADRIAVLNDKNLIQFSTPKEIYEQPENVFIAEFVGSPKINLLECKVIEKTGRFILKTPFGSFEIIKRKNELQNYGKERIVVGIRPEAISISNSKDGIDILNGEIINREYLGNHYLLWFKELPNFKVMVKKINNLNTSNLVKIDLNEDSLIFFDYESKCKI